MADVTWGVKVSEELKQQITEMIEKEGIASKDFIQQMVNTYTVEKVKQTVPAVAEDLKELQNLTQRINNIYLNLGYRIENISKTQQEEFANTVVSKDAVIQEIQGRLDTVKSKYEAFKEAYKTETEEKNKALDRVNELIKNLENLSALVSEYKEKNDTLQGIVTEYKGYKEQNGTLKSEMDVQTQKIYELQHDLRYSREYKDKLKAEYDEFKVQAEKDLKVQEQAAKETLENALAKAQIETDRALINIEREYEQKINDTTRECQQKIDVVSGKHAIEVGQYQEQLQQAHAKHSEEVKQYQEKYKELLERMEELQKQKVSPKTQKVANLEQK